MEEMILSNLKKEGQKMPVPSLRIPFNNNSGSANGHNFTLASGLKNPNDPYQH